MILDQFKLDGKVALVTGAGRGIGQAVAIGLAEAGADVALVSLHAPYETAERARALGRKAVVIQADLADRQQAPLILQQVVSELGALDILVNNAGMIRRAPLLDFTEQDWDEVVELNQSAVFFLSQAAARLMARQGRRGKIINIASLLSFQGGIRIPSYTAAKSAVAGLTRSFANELAPHGIQVNAIAPGYFETDNTAPLRADPQRSGDILGRIPAARWGRPEELQGAVVYLASAASDYMTGSVMVVDGGWMAR
jgi:2-deoxy-D-gluconate 3-dehydrogenase